jgi:hypothetical protein
VHISCTRARRVFSPETTKALRLQGFRVMGGTGLEPVTPSLSSQSAGRGVLALARISKGIPPPGACRPRSEIAADSAGLRRVWALEPC